MEEEPGKDDAMGGNFSVMTRNDMFCVLYHSKFNRQFHLFFFNLFINCVIIPVTFYPFIVTAHVVEHATQIFEWRDLYGA